jgi:hypothetical protein
LVLSWSQLENDPEKQGGVVGGLAEDGIGGEKRNLCCERKLARGIIVGKQCAPPVSRELGQKKIIKRLENWTYLVVDALFRAGMYRPPSTVCKVLPDRAYNSI